MIERRRSARAIHATSGLGHRWSALGTWKVSRKCPGKEKCGGDQKPSIARKSLLAKDWKREPVMGFEPMTCCLRNSCSTPELHWRADSEGRNVWQKNPGRQAGFRRLRHAGCD